MLVALAAMPILTACGGDDRPELIVGAASSLLPLLEELEPIFEVEAQIDLTITYGASGIVARQIEQGAPIDVFLSADLLLTARMVSEHVLRQDSMVPIGQSVLVAIRPANGLISNFQDAERIAIANPETAPYGASAKRLFQRNGVWDQVMARLVYAESAMQTLQFVRAGEADIGLVPLSLVAQNREGVERVSERSHRVVGAERIAQVGAVTAFSSQVESSALFLDFLTSDAAQSVFGRHGYVRVPKEASVASEG